MSEVKVLTGKVVWFDSKKGLGFICKDDGSGDIFVHWSNIVAEGFKTLKPDQVVSYELGQNHKGLQATCVRILSEPAQEK